MLGIADDLLILLCLVLTVVFTTIVDPKKTHPKDFWSSTVLPSHSRLPKGHFPPECCRVHLPFSLGSPCPTRSPDVLNGENGGNISGGARGHDCQEPQAGPKTGPLRPRPLPGIETKSLTDREDRAPKKGADGLKRRAESGLGTQILIELCRIHIHSLQVCVSMIFFSPLTVVYPSSQVHRWRVCFPLCCFSRRAERSSRPSVRARWPRSCRSLAVERTCRTPCSVWEWGWICGFWVPKSLLSRSPDASSRFRKRGRAGWVVHVSFDWWAGDYASRVGIHNTWVHNKSLAMI